MVLVLCVVEAVEQLLVGGGFVVGALGDFGRQTTDFGLQQQHLVKSLGGLLDQRGGVGDLHLLGQVADRAFAVHGHGARRGLLFAHDQAQERGFARAVLAHQTDAVARVDEKRYVVEKGPAPVAHGEIVQRYHSRKKVSGTAPVQVPENVQR